MADLEFKDDDTIVSMFSAEGENIQFVKKIDPRDRNVENWMGDVEKMMCTSVRAAFYTLSKIIKRRKELNGSYNIQVNVSLTVPRFTGLWKLRKVSKQRE